VKQMADDWVILF